MRYTRNITLVLYVAWASLWVYWVLDRQLLFGSDIAGLATLVLVGLIHVAVGFAIGRNWAALLPLLTAAIAAPLGYPSANKGEPWPLWLGLLFWAPVYMLVVAIGVGVRRWYDRRSS
jgi:hypothetical protein